ncbi:MAG TPA: hypothetical protein DEO39_04355 [Clostridiales bacterium]|nr:hypothetical protein [Clostridiales bacterium]
MQPRFPVIRSLVHISCDLNDSIDLFVFRDDPAEHDGIAFEALPEDWTCPRCRQSKDNFNKA